LDSEVVHIVAWWAFAGACIFGVVANKTHFCTMGGISDWINIGIKTRFRTWMLAIGIALIGTQAMDLLGWIDLNQSIYLTPAFGWAGYLVGGFVFGIGMTIGSGCGQRTLVRVGGGNLKSVVVLLVMGITAYMTLRGLLAVARLRFQSLTMVDLSELGWSDQSFATILSAWTGAERSIIQVTLTVLVGAGAIYFAFKEAAYRKDVDNIVAALTVGLLAVGGWYITGVIGNDDFEPVPLESLTFIAPSGNTINYLMTYTGATINFGIAVVFGVITGSLAYALASRTFRIETFASANDLINHLAAGVLMGFGGVLAVGCTIGQGIVGMSTLAIGSLLALGSIIAGCALTIKMQYHLLDSSLGEALHQTLVDIRLLPRGKSGD